MTAEYLAQQRDEAEARAERLDRELQRARSDSNLAHNINQMLATERDEANARRTEQAAIIDRLTAELSATNDHDGKLVADLRARIDRQREEITRHLATIDRLEAELNSMATDRKEAHTETTNALLARIAVLECELKDAQFSAAYWLKECIKWRASAETIAPTPAETPTDAATVEALRADLDAERNYSSNLAAERDNLMATCRTHLTNATRATEALADATRDRDRADYEAQKWADRAHAAEYKLKTMPNSDTAWDNANTISRIADMAIIAFMDKTTIHPEDLRDVLFSRGPEARAADQYNTDAHNADQETQLAQLDRELEQAITERRHAESTYGWKSEQGDTAARKVADLQTQISAIWHRDDDRSTPDDAEGD